MDNGWKAPVAIDTDLSYTNKLTGKTARFTPKLNEIVATFQPDQATAAFAPSTGVPARLSHRSAPSNAIVVKQGPNFAILQVPPSDIQSVGKAPIDLPEVANTIPAMIDADGSVRRFLPDEVTVRFRPGVPDDTALRHIRALGARVVQAQRTPGYYRITVPNGRAPFETVRALSAIKDVFFAEPVEIGIDDYAADLSRQWALRNTGQTVNDTAGVAGADINIETAWRVTRGSPNVVIVIIDTGIKSTHPNLAPNVLPQTSEDWNFADDAETTSDDHHGHGTHVSGIAAGAEINGGMIGVAPECRLLGLRVNLDSGNYPSRADAISYVAALAMAQPEKRFVINCSWRMAGDHAGIYAAILEATAAGVLVVAAAGNANVDTGFTPFYPASYPEVLTVGATDQQDAKLSISNYGAMVDVYAPGANIYSTSVYDPYVYLDGTSQACPHVAGLGALILACDPSLTVAMVREVITGSCTSIDAANPDLAGKLGHGRINAGKALARARQNVSPHRPARYAL